MSVPPITEQTPSSSGISYGGGLHNGVPVIIPKESVASFAPEPGSLAGQAMLGSLGLSDYTATGCHIIGCSPESTFTVVATYYVQILPSPSSSLISLVQPAPPYDPMAYEVYTRVMRQLPIATYKDDNDFGTWFRKALSIIRKIAPIVGSAFGPAGSAVGRMVERAARAGERAVPAPPKLPKEPEKPARRPRRRPAKK